MQFKEVEIGTRFVFVEETEPKGTFRKITGRTYVCVYRGIVYRCENVRAEVAVEEELANAA